jgi:hypothetical protein
MKRIGILALILSVALTSFAACSFSNTNSSLSTSNSDSSSPSEDSATDASTDNSSNGSTDDSTDDSSTDSSSSSGDSASDSSSDSSFSGDSSSDDTSNEDSSTDSEEKQIYYTVQFDTDGGSTVASVTVLSGETLTQPATPTKITQVCEYVFIGWFYNGEQWDFENGVVTQDMTLTARWKEGEKYTDPFLPKD